MSETVETGSLEDFKRLVEEFVASTLQKTKMVEAFTDFCDGGGHLLGSRES